ADFFNSGLAEIFIDNISSNKNDRPNRSTGSQVEIQHIISKKDPAYRIKSEGLFSRKYFNTNNFRYNGIGEENSAEDDKKICFFGLKLQFIGFHYSTQKVLPSSLITVSEKTSLASRSKGFRSPYREEKCPKSNCFTPAALAIAAAWAPVLWQVSLPLIWSLFIKVAS